MRNENHEKEKMPSKRKGEPGEILIIAAIAKL